MQGGGGGVKGNNVHIWYIIIHHISSQKESKCQRWPPPSHLAPFPFWHSSWWAVIYPEAELTASVCLKQQTATGTNLQLKKPKADIRVFFSTFTTSVLTFLVSSLPTPETLCSGWLYREHVLIQRTHGPFATLVVGIFTLLHTLHPPDPWCPFFPKTYFASKEIS